MKIIELDKDKTEKTINNIYLFLRRHEIEELIDSLKDLLKRAGEDIHHHISDSDFSSEITISLEKENNE